MGKITDTLLDGKQKQQVNEKNKTNPTISYHTYDYSYFNYIIFCLEGYSHAIFYIKDSPTILKCSFL